VKFLHTSDWHIGKTLQPDLAHDHGVSAGSSRWPAGSGLWVRGSAH